MNIKNKLLSTFALSVLFAAGAAAQGFSSFEVEGALFKANIKNVTSGASRVEVIVGPDTDLKNIKSKYRLLSACRMEDKISKDFTSPQKVEIYKESATKEWIIQVKKLQAASLPLELDFSDKNSSVYTSATKGWATQGTDESKPSVVRFGNNGVSFIVAFEGEASEVSYDLHLVGAKGTEFDGKFAVETSTDGKKWTNLAIFDSKNPFKPDSSFTNELTADVRFIKWTYVSRQKQNVNLNKIIVSGK